MDTTTPPARRVDCPDWCHAPHAPSPADEDDRLHTSDPVEVTDTVSARLCLSVDAHGQVVEGPYVLVGFAEYTLDQARVLGEGLLQLVREAGVSVSRPG